MIHTIGLIDVDGLDRTPAAVPVSPEFKKRAQLSRLGDACDLITWALS